MVSWEWKGFYIPTIPGCVVRAPSEARFNALEFLQHLGLQLGVNGVEEQAAFKEAVTSAP